MSQYIYTDMAPELHIKIKSLLSAKVKIKNSKQHRAAGSVLVQRSGWRDSTSGVETRITFLKAPSPFGNKEPKN